MSYMKGSQKLERYAWTGLAAGALLIFFDQRVIGGIISALGIYFFYSSIIERRFEEIERRINRLEGLD